jgi:gamma-glutamyl phosphate reductase
MTEQDKAKLSAYAADASKKLAALPERNKAEAAAAAEEGRAPHPIDPLTEVHPSLLAPLLAGLKDVPADLEEPVGTYRKVCARQPNTSFALQSSKLLAILKHAGVVHAEV